MPDSMRMRTRQLSHIYLIGFAGSGKSTVGRLLAQRLRRVFIDTDMLVERTVGATIPDLFARHGEKYFRRVETSVLREVARDTATPTIIALGGGAVTRSVNRSMLKHTGTVVYLSCPARELYRRLKHQHYRPLLEVPSGTAGGGGSALERRIKILLEERKQYYEMADLRIAVVGKTPARIAAEIAEGLRD